MLPPTTSEPSIQYVTRLLTLRLSESDAAWNENLSLQAMRSGETPRSQRRKTNRTKGAGSSFGEQARSRLRRTENLPGDRPGIPRQNAVAFGGGRMSIQLIRPLDFLRQQPRGGLGD